MGNPLGIGQTVTTGTVNAPDVWSTEAFQAAGERAAKLLIDCRELESGSVWSCDLCIVGGGAVGIALARELLGSGLDVVLLESGGLTFENDVQDLYEGDESGDLLEGPGDYLRSTRLRFFGGTTNHWNGWTRPLDASDLDPREWMASTGWPLTREELDPYYERAAKVVEVSPFDYALRQLWGKLPFLLDSEFETSYVHVSPPTRFGPRYRQELEAARDVRVMLHGTLTGIRADESRRTVTALEVAAMPEHRFMLQPRATVLAAGAIENARLLLASDLGNRHDQVGRYFMDHPRRRIGYAVLPLSRRGTARYIHTHELPGWGHRVRAVLRPTEELQREHRIPSALIVLEHLGFRHWPPLTPAVSELAETSARLDGEKRRPDAKTRVTAIDLTLEPVPNPSSRVRLSARRDAFGVPRTRLEWKLSAQDRDGALRVSRLIVRRLALDTGARAQLLVAPEAPLDNASGSPHQLGTTRMHSDPMQGVVDVDSRVHGMDNLWVGGGSVFPVAGCSNPTLTLLALTMRLADRLRRQLRV